MCNKLAEITIVKELTQIKMNGQATLKEVPKWKLVEQEILKYTSKFCPANEEEAKAIYEGLEIRALKKGAILLKEGEMATECYFILKGCIRQYYIIDGEDRTTAFYTEEQCISSSMSATWKTPSKNYLACVEDTLVTAFTNKNEVELYEKFPRIETLSRIETEKELGEYQELLVSYITTTPEERYLDLLKNRPDLLERVPQYQLASFLGIKPESLSRIRKRIMLK